tara:strand:- start:1278 stop:1442 length:165 start_codon:yes stop_codon:yes gene_type:complete
MTSTTNTATYTHNLTRYQQEMLSALYASLDYLNCEDLPGVAELNAAINAIEAQA